MTESDKIKAKFKEHAKAHGLCGDVKVFTLGSHGTVYTGCGLREDHKFPKSLPDGEYVKPIMHHVASQTAEDGSQVIFKWPVA